MCDISGVPSGCSGQQMNAVKPPVRACTSRTRNRCSIRSASVSPRPYIIVTEVFIPWRWASSCTPSHSSVCAFFGATRWRTASTRISPPPPGMLSSPAVAQLADHLGHRQPEALAEEHHLATGEKPWMWIGMMLLDVAHQVEVPLERDVGVVPALEQDLHAAERLALVDLRADLLEAQHVAFAVLRPAVERAEPAVGDADVGVVDVPVDDVGDHRLGMVPPPLGVGELGRARAGSARS